MRLPAIVLCYTIYALIMTIVSVLWINPWIIGHSVFGSQEWQLRYMLTAIPWLVFILAPAACIMWMCDEKDYFITPDKKEKEE